MSSYVGLSSGMLSSGLPSGLLCRGLSSGMQSKGVVMWNINICGDVIWDFKEMVVICDVF
jgi:hypothetical protein